MRVIFTLIVMLGVIVSMAALMAWLCPIQLCVNNITKAVKAMDIKNYLALHLAQLY